ncbi:hypothetical protein ABPG74_006620 [Tetrahymena malaccensis]
MNRSVLITFIFVGLIMSSVFARSVYDHKQSHVSVVSNLNFVKQVQKTRESTKTVQILHFYKMNDGHSTRIAKEMDQLANQYKGLFYFGAVNCGEEPTICEKEKITQYPTVRVYPPLPLPSIDVEVPADSLASNDIFKLASRYLHDNSVEINTANIDTFISEHPAVPKVFLFTDKKGTPLIYKGLSVALEGKQFFGIVRHTEEALVKKYQVKKFPSILIVITGERKPIPYTGEMKYQDIFNFLNVYSQTFVPGGTQEQSATKSWLNELVPEMHIKSARDICLGQEGILCVLLFHSGKPDVEIIDTFKTLHSQYGIKHDRGLQYKFMWIDAAQEQKWAQFFKFEGNPKVVLINPGKRKRVLDHEGEVTISSLKSTIEKISNGDARFKRLADSDIPEFSAIRKDL